MKGSLYRNLLIFTTLLMVGCATTHPLGIKDGDWQQMSQQQQHEARMQQARLDEIERQRRADQAEARRLQELAHQAELERIRQNPRFGDIIQCSVSNGQTYTSSDWHPAQPMAFELVRGETREVLFPRADRPTQQSRGTASFDGLTVKICRPVERDCSVMAGTESEYRRGKTQSIRSARLIRGELRCQFPRGY
ncbi:hypothetical protein [Marinospirillum alkaliphilum]|uniref:hypothetical protein n=1 Tax=Marinospirillum alkaliphilum TaxID=148454 RepID=UPI00116080E6|nr:hypothetical protein [Marinospirillum alkaliphilum]